MVLNSIPDNEAENPATRLTHEVQPLFPPPFSHLQSQLAGSGRTFALASARARGGPRGHHTSANAYTSGNSNIRALAHAQASGPENSRSMAHAESGALHNNRVLAQAHARSSSYRYG